MLFPMEPNITTNMVCQNETEQDICGTISRRVLIQIYFIWIRTR